MIVHEMIINEKYLLRISKDTVNGISFGQVRIWILDKVRGDHKPTTKGFGFELSHLDDLIKGMIHLKAIDMSVYEA